MFYRKILLKNRKYVLNNYEDNSIKLIVLIGTTQTRRTHCFDADIQAPS